MRDIYGQAKTRITTTRRQGGGAEAGIVIGGKPSVGGRATDKPIPIKLTGADTPTDLELYGPHGGTRGSGPPPEPNMQIVPARNAEGKPCARALLIMDSGEALPMAELTEDMSIKLDQRGLSEFMGAILERQIAAFRQSGEWMG